MKNPKTLFVSSFILGNNVLSLKKEGDSHFSCLGLLDKSNLSSKVNPKFISISPNFISINKSNQGNAIVVSKEFLGEYFIYKISIKGETLRVRTKINKSFNIGDKCFLSFADDSYYFVYPGGEKIYI